MKPLKWIIALLVAVTLLCALFAGVSRFGWPENSTTARPLESGWTYGTDTGESGALSLPWALTVPLETGRVTLTTTLPQWEGEGYALHFVSMEQTVEVWIGGKLRYTYGGSPEAGDFVYRSARHINQVPLCREDSGKILTIVYRAPPLFRIELGLLRDVWFGAESDLVLHQFGNSAGTILISLFTLLITLSAVLTLVTYRGVPLGGTLCALLLAVVAVIFHNAETAALWPVLHHVPTLSALVDWNFYFLDPLIPMAAWLTMYASGWTFRRWRRWAALGAGTVYILAAALSLAGLFNFNLARPFFMVFSFFLTIVLVTDHQKRREGWTHCALALPALVLLAGYYLDYLKYCLMVLPLSTEWSAFLQLKLPFQFFTGIALVCFTLLVLRATMGNLARRQAGLQEEAATAQLQAQYVIRQYETMCQQDLSLRSLRHDMQHHLRTAHTLLASGRSEEAEQYLGRLTDTVAALRLSPWCANHVADITIGWYADQFSRRSIPFTAEANIPALSETAHADVCCVLSNALQNALEGCAGQTQPYVSLWASPRGNSLVIKVENSCAPGLRPTRQGFLTTKSGDGHGLGLTSMRAAVERHNGYFQTEAADGVFRLDAVLCGVFPSTGVDECP